MERQARQSVCELHGHNIGKILLNHPQHQFKSMEKQSRIVILLFTNISSGTSEEDNAVSH